MSERDEVREALVACLAFGSWDVRHALAEMLGVAGPDGTETDRLPAAYRIADALLSRPAPVVTEAMVRQSWDKAEEDVTAINPPLYGKHYDAAIKSALARHLTAALSARGEA